MAIEKQVTINVKKGKNARIGRLGVTEGGFVVGNPLLAIDTNFDVQATNAFDIVSGGQYYTVAAGADFDTGTARVIAIGLWGAALLSVDTDGTPYLQWNTDDFAAEADAVASLDAITPTGDVVIGYVTVQADAAATFTAGTDALITGTGGTPADATNYYGVFGWVL